MEADTRKIELGYFSNINRTLLNAMLEDQGPPGFARVLEVGCGTGALGKVYKTMYPECYWAGVEKEPWPADVAGRHLDAVWDEPVENLSAEELLFWDVPIENLTSKELVYKGGPYDALVFGDVLEHLEDPWEVLSFLVKNTLIGGGKVFACIPNIQHWTVMLGLLQGRFDYQDEGILDRTHLRFFTLSSIKDLMVKSGLKVEKVKPRVALPPTKDIEDWVYSTFAQMSGDRTGFITVQYVVTAQKV